MADAASMIPVSPKTECAQALAREFPEELAHLEQVGRVAGLLFRALQPIHGMGPVELELLCCAALLHDIGISVSYSGHHKHSRRLIGKASLPALTREERDLVANVARYHRKAKPAQKHGAYRSLTEPQQELVSRLAAILRIADGLDRAHENAVSEVDASAETPLAWTIGLYGPGSLTTAAWGAQRKAELFEEVYGVRLRFEPRGLPETGTHNSDA